MPVPVLVCAQCSDSDDASAGASGGARDLESLRPRVALGRRKPWGRDEAGEGFSSCRQTAAEQQGKQRVSMCRGGRMGKGRQEGERRGKGKKKEDGLEVRLFW